MNKPTQNSQQEVDLQLGVWAGPNHTSPACYEMLHRVSDLGRIDCNDLGNGNWMRRGM